MGRRSCCRHLEALQRRRRAELGELVDGTKPDRSSPEQITLYKSVRVAVQDGAATALVLRAARERGTGRDVEL